jgi:uncharacterized protein
MPETNEPRRVSTREKVAALSMPALYGLPASESIVVKQTHMSWVFLAGDRAFKLKKPVIYPFLDFSTLEARETNCREELRLNRRLARDVYLFVSPLTLETDGTLAVMGRGQIVDWLVVMRRLPDELMLDAAISCKTVTREHVVQVADLLATFYADLSPEPISDAGYVELFQEEHRKNRQILLSEKSPAVARKAQGPIETIERLLRQPPGFLLERTTGRRICEGHGDLRPEHVCLSSPPVVIDCLEFSRRLRLADPFDELSFLAMECERLGAEWIGEVLLSRCMADLEDYPCDRLLAFYRTYRACLRARLAISRLLERNIRDPDKWEPLAIRYLEIAALASARLAPL